MFQYPPIATSMKSFLSPNAIRHFLSFKPDQPSQVMKKRRISRNSVAKKQETEATNVKDEVIQCLGSPFADLPPSLLVIILLKLSVKRVVICKCVCKAWRDLISEPEFAMLHFRQAETIPMIRTTDCTRVSRILYLLQPEKSPDFNPGFGCYFCESCNDYGWCGHQLNMKLETKLKLPLRNMELVFKDNEGLKCDFGGKAGRKKCIKVRPNYQYYRIVNSCNGLLCLSEPFHNIPLVVCNPVTGDFVNLPETQILGDPPNPRSYVDCGLGFSPTSNQYKVIGMFHNFNRDVARGEKFSDGIVVEVLTLGNRTWKNIGNAPCSVLERVCPVYLNGALHWFHPAHSSEFFDCLDSILSFDIENECFKSLPPPPEQKFTFVRGRCSISMGVFGGCLCICNATFYDPIDVWVMKNYGVGNSWTQLYSIDTCTKHRWPCGLYQPVKEMKNGAVLFFHYPKSALIYYHPERRRFKYYRVRGVKSKFEAIVHTPSFISLKDALQGDDMQVQNVYSRCGKFKLPGECRTFSLVEVDREFETDTEGSDEN